MPSTSESAGDRALPTGPIGPEDRANLPFTIVGIGASAGGVEALSRFVHDIPPDSGMAYVVIQHLSPEGKSLLPEILARQAAIPVREIIEGVVVEPNVIYAIRPGTTVTLSDGAFRCGEPVEMRGHRRPVDDFFRSLACEQKERSIIVVLSGTGTNGTAGAQAVKAAGGLCVAQDPDTAEFPGMPRSLIQSGYADQILAIEAIPEFLCGYVRNPVVALPERESEALGADRERQSLGEIHALLRTKTGHDFRGYRRPTVLRRIQRRMAVAGVTDLASYARVMRDHHGEAVALANDLMINVTGFFRDPEAWDALRDGAVASLVDRLPSGETLRAWVAACSSGEEAYTLAMVIAEASHKARKQFEVKIFATDTAERSLGFARAGIYPGGIEGDLSQERIERFFDKDEHSYRIKKEIRDMVVFAPHNLLRDPPFSRLDLCTCRNLLIYLEPETQQRVLSLLTFSVRYGGYLFLGNTESLGGAEQSFEVVSKRWRIFRRVGPAQHRLPELSLSPRLAMQDVIGPERITATMSAVQRGERSPSISYERALLEEFSPPTVVTDRQERMLYVTGDVSPFIMYPAGELTASIVDATRPPLRAAVRTALRQAMDAHTPACIEASLEGEQGGATVRITAAALKSHAAGRSLRVSFEIQTPAERESPAERPQAVVAMAPSADGLEDEIRVLRRELQVSLEAFEASNEELKSSNEEVLSVNEELQSANEELETSKEELQSLNEELTTVNAQLQSKIVELEQTTNDLSNLLSSTSIAVMFLDAQLLVRRFTPAMQDLLELIPTDIGRPISDLAPKFTTIGSEVPPHEELRRSARVVLQSLAPMEAEVRSQSGRYYLQRTLPYRTTDNHIAGVVVTFIDVTARSAAENSLKLLQSRLQSALEQSPAALIIVEAGTGKVMHANRRAAALFSQPYPLPFLNESWTEALRHFRGWWGDGRKLQPAEWPLARSLSEGEVVTHEEVEVATDEGSSRSLSVSSAPIRAENGELLGAVAAFWDISDLKSAERALRASASRLRLIVEGARDFAIILMSSAGTITEWNSGATRLFGWSEDEVRGQSASLIFTSFDRAAGVPEQEMSTALEAGCAIDERWHQRKDGSVLWANGVLSVARDEQGEVQGFVKIMRDNTKRKEAEDQLHAATEEATRARARAEEANRAKDDFISMVSHELRTPLNTMRLWLRLLSNPALGSRDQEEGRQALERAVDAQRQLIEDLLDVSRIASGKLRLEQRPVDLSAVIHAAVDTVRPVAQRKDVKLNFSGGNHIGIVMADPDRIQQVVWNLLSNAVKFTPSGGEVTLELDRTPDDVTIRVTDTGIGIKAALLPQVFERFKQGESGAARQHSGLGLGLAIAKQLVELHGGAILASSDGEGRGATFEVRLPRREEVGAAAEKLQSVGTAATSLAGLRVMLVEDESSTRDVCKRLLDTGGMQVDAFASTAAAREAFFLMRPDVIVSDIGMPGEDGYLLIGQIRQLEQDHDFPRTPAVALTAFASPKDRRRALDAGYDAHVTKPVDVEQLFREIAALTGREQAK